MMNVRALAVAALTACAAAIGGTVFAAMGQPDGQPPEQKSDAQRQAAGEIAQVAFLSGTWSGTMNGAHVEEIWSAPSGNCVMGCFRWMRADGTAAMYEMLAITAEPEGVRLRLRHYSAQLAGKELPDKPVTLRLARAEPGRAEFVAEKDCGDLSGVHYTVTGDTLKIEVLFALQGEKARKPLVFNLSRGGSGAQAPSQPRPAEK